MDQAELFFHNVDINFSVIFLCNCSFVTLFEMYINKKEITYYSFEYNNKCLRVKLF